MPTSVPNQHPSRPPALGAPRLAIIGEAPGSEETRLGYPFAGASGSYLNSVLAYAGIDRAACFVGNVCQHQPPGNQFTAWKWSDERVQAGIAALLADLDAFAPTLILTLGNVPLHLFKQGNVPPPVFKNGNVDWPNKVSVWRGSLFAAAVELFATATPTLRAPHDPHPLLSPASGPNGPIAPPALDDPPLEPLAHTTCAAHGQASISRPGSPSSVITGAGEGIGGASMSITLAANTFSTPPGNLNVAGAANQVTVGNSSGTMAWKCLATYHPAFVLRSWKHHIDLCLDMKRARIESQTADLNLPALEVACGPCE